MPTEKRQKNWSPKRNFAVNFHFCTGQRNNGSKSQKGEATKCLASAEGAAAALLSQPPHCHSSSSLPHSCNISLSVILVGQRRRGSRRGEAGVAVRAQIKIKLQVPIMCEIPTLLACLLLCALNEVALATHTHTHKRLSHTLTTMLWLVIWANYAAYERINLTSAFDPKWPNGRQLAAAKKAIKNAFDAMPQADKIGRKALPVKRVGVSNQRDAFKCN